MSTVSQASRPTRSLGGGRTLADVKLSGRGLPSRGVLHGVEGIGKTSFGAHAPKPVFIQTEDGLETLIDQGRLPEVPHFPVARTWTDVLSSIDALIAGEHDYRMLVGDTANGIERLCHEHVCRRDFEGEWGEKGFAGYQRGFEVALADWREFLAKLDTLRETKRMAILLLCHTKVGTFRNPEGPDYDRYMPDMHQKTWGLTHKWADMVLFANFFTVVQTAGKNKEDPTKKGKASGGQDRLIYTVRHPSYDAKNRLGLPEEIDMGDSGATAWSNFQAAVKAGRNSKGGA